MRIFLFVGSMSIFCSAKLKLVVRTKLPKIKNQIFLLVFIFFQRREDKYLAKRVRIVKTFAREK